MFHGRYQQLIAGNFVVIRCNWESRPSNGKQHDDNYMEGYFSSFRTFGKLFSYSDSCILLYFSSPDKHRAISSKAKVIIEENLRRC